jgi:hypothetical protein
MPVFYVMGYAGFLSELSQMCNIYTVDIKKGIGMDNTHRLQKKWLLRLHNNDRYEKVA